MDDTQHDKASDISQVAKKELEILDFWNKEEIFKKTLDKKSPNGKFVFYDGPPFANGKPHYGHILPGTIKDVIPRYKTMKGFSVDRQWGWDCHGLPVENLVQKENDLQTSKDIENFGIENFNIKAKESVFTYEAEWKKIIPRTGRWVNMENPYTTMHPLYTQSVWWGFKKLHDKGLVYEDFKVMHVSPELETTLSNFEVNQGYKDIKDLSLTAKFELKDEKGTFVLAWTTTPWTLPGNVALAVGGDIDYVKIEIEGSKYILAKALLDSVVEETYDIVDEFKGGELVGKEYQPLFNYYIDEDIEGLENAWKIYSADFVTTSDGTGVVHIAPAFGDDDYSLLKKHKLPFIQHVHKNGVMKEEVLDFAGLEAKPKENPMQTDIEVVKVLAEKGKLYSKKKIEHSYPHCWRTDAPLLNFATSSWFIKVTDFKNKLIGNNNKVKWVPENVGSLRFGNWLKEARDWSVSRSRFWGTPIPIWKSEDGKDHVVIGSLHDLKSRVKSSNKFLLARHGQSDHNVKNFLAEDNENHPSHLTEKGEDEALKLAKALRGKKIDLVYVSPLHRTQETMKVLKKELGFSDEQIITDKRLKEFQSGKNGMHHDKFTETFGDHYKIYQDNEFGETLLDIRKRVGEFISEIDSKHEDKTILVVSHDWPIWMLKSVCEGWTKEEAIEEKAKRDDFVKTGNVLETNYFKLPHDRNFELDLHRPYIDRVEFEEKGKNFKRIPDVFDGWVDSGSMPFASNYYPMKKDKFNPGSLLLKSKNFPADFIAEGLDQTRGWFYTLMVLNSGLFGKSPFKNVVVNGLVLAEDGRKMAKSLKNYPDMDEVLNKFGADALRYYLMNSPAVKADDIKFSERGIDEVMKKIILRLDNVVSFYELFKTDELEVNNNSGNVLDKWILGRLSEVFEETTNGLENYELDKAARPFTDFVDDLSAWYLRRSRDRIKEDGSEKKEAMETLKYVLVEFSKLIAPFMPFKAEDVYKRVCRSASASSGVTMKDSVHLENWPKISYEAEGTIEDMKVTRNIVTKALEKRASSGIKVRQPLSKLEVKDLKLSDEYIEIIKDEVNVKEVTNNESMMEEVMLHTKLSTELIEEGNAREVMRAVQDLRKKNKLSPDDEILVHVEYPEGLEKTFIKYMEEMKKATKTTEFVKFNLGDVDPVKINDFEIKLVIQKK
jgi:isoleucyl-tRNA synthetase